MKFSIFFIFIIVGYFLLSKYYLEPMEHLAHDEEILAEEKIKVEESVIHVKVFEANISLEKEILRIKNEAISKEPVDINSTYGTHHIAI